MFAQMFAIFYRNIFYINSKLMHARAWYALTNMQDKCTLMVYSMQVPELFIFLFTQSHYILYNEEYSFLY